MPSQPQTPRSTEGSRGVAMLYKKEFHDRVCVVHKEVDACYMWIRINRGDLRELYIAICYFPPAYSRFAPLGESPYLPLYDDIIRFATMGDIINGDEETRKYSKMVHRSGCHKRGIVKHMCSTNTTIEDKQEYGSHGRLYCHSRYVFLSVFNP